MSLNVLQSRRLAFRSRWAAWPVRRLLALLVVFLFPVSCSSDADSMKVALTHDDGPNEPYTSQLLEMFAQYGVRATFFVLGEQVDSYPATVASMAAAGHEVGNHTYSHLKLTEGSFDVVTDEIAKGDDAICRATGSHATLLRCPYDEVPSELPQWCAENCYQLVSADIWGMDWELTAAEDIASHVLDRIYPGAIILLHDGLYENGSPPGTDRALTVEATRIIIEDLQSRGYEFVTVSELAE